MAMGFDNVWERFWEVAADHPEAPAILQAGETISYGSLAARSAALAARLAPAVLKGQAVAVMAEITSDYVSTLLALWQVGAVFVPLDPSLTGERLKLTLIDTEPVLILTTERGRLLLEKTIPDYRDRIAVLDGPKPTTSNPTSPHLWAPDDLCYVYFTTGSSGRPKGIAGRFCAVAHFIQWEIETFGLGPGTRVSQLTSPSFDAFLRDVFVPLCCGGTICVPDPTTVLSAERLANWIETVGINLLHCVPSLFRGLLDSPLEIHEFTELSWVLLAGERLPVADVRRWWSRFGERIGLVNLYGSSETTMTKLFHPITRADLNRTSIPIGRPMAGAKVLVLDDQGQPTAPGKVGLLHVSTPYCSLGYYRKGRIIQDGFHDEGTGWITYNTGDLGRVLEEGDHDLLGRRDRQIKVRGMRLDLDGVEHLLHEHEAVVEAAVQDRLDSTGTTFLTAHLVTRKKLTFAVLKNHLARYLAEPLLPTAFVWWERLPRLFNGKVDYQKLAAASLRGEGSHRIATPIEGALCAQFKAILELEEVGLDSNFFELGGHSLLATRLLAKIAYDLGYDIPLPAFFDHPTPAGLADRVQGMPRRPKTRPTESRTALGTNDGSALLPVARNQALPLSFAQQRLWFLDRYKPGNPAYHIHRELVLEGPLAAALLEQSLFELANGQESLRLRIMEKDGIPYQEVVEGQRLELRLIDLSQTLLSKTELAVLADRERRTRLRLDHGPLLRLLLFRLDETKHLFLLTIHHIIADGWSMGILHNELFTAYNHLLSAEPTSPRPIRIQYADIAFWQRGKRFEAALVPELEYWCRQLAEAPPLIGLPLDRPRPRRSSSRGDQVTFQLSEEQSAKLDLLAQKAGATRFMALLSLFYGLLGRYNPHLDLVVGTPIANRYRIEMEPLIGFFVNTLVLRTNLSGDPDFETVLARVRKVALEAYAHQRLPFERLVEVLNPRRSNVHPLFQVLFILHNTPEKRRDPLGITLTRPKTSRSDAKFDLTLSFARSAGGLAGSFRYRTDLFDRATIERLSRDFAALLAAAVEGPTRPLSQLLKGRAVPAAQTAAILCAEGSVSSALNAFVPVQQLFSSIAARFGNRIAVEQEGRQTSYADLARLAGNIAGKLRAGGARKGDRVALFLERISDIAAAMIGVLELGCVFVPFDPGAPVSLMRAMATAAQPGWVVSEPDSAHRIAPIFGTAITRIAVGHEIQSVPASPKIPAGPDQPCSIFFTSGSTGKPKGILGRLGAIDHFVSWEIGLLAIDPGGRVSQFTNPTNDAFLRDLFVPLCAGATLCVPDKRNVLLDAPRLAAWLASQRITTIHTVPSMMRFLLAETQPRLPELAHVLLVGEPFSPAEYGSWQASLGPAVQWVNLYGSTETNLAKVYHILEPADRFRKRIPAGKPLPGTSVLVTDSKGLSSSAGSTGEIWIQSPFCALGYLDDYGNEDPFRHRVGPEGFAETRYQTGDMGRIDHDGRLECLGRLDRQLKVHGNRVEPAEIETVLRFHPEIEDAHLTRARQETGLCAFIATAARLTPTQVRAFLSDRLEFYKIPRQWVFTDVFPRLANGKLDRMALEHLKPQPEAENWPASLTHNEEVMTLIWCGVLDQKRVSLHDNFFALGGHSLLATRVAARVHEMLGIEMPLHHLFERPTIAGLCQRLTGLHRRQWQLPSPPPLRSVSRQQLLPLSPAQHRLWFLDRLIGSRTPYIMFQGFRLKGPLDLKALEKALEEVATRHEELRTCFPAIDGLPTRAHVTAPRLVIVDLRSCHRRCANRLCDLEATRRLVLEKDPPWRVTLLRTGRTSHRLCFVIHHIIADERSSEILKHELFTLYNAYQKGQPSPLQKLVYQYADYAVWQSRAGKLWSAQLAYWRKRLAGAPPLLMLPLDRPRPATPSYEGATYVTSLEGDTLVRCRQLALSLNTTPFMSFLGVFAILLGRYSGQRDLVIGTPVDHRFHKVLEGVIGLFVNTVALRLSLEENPNFFSLLRQTRKTVLDAHAHSELPFERLVAALQPDRNLAHNPIFQVMFRYGKQVTDRAEPARLAVRASNGKKRSAKFALDLSIRDRGGSLKLVWLYAVELFEPETIQAMARSFAVLLKRLPLEPESPVLRIAILSECENKRLLAALNENQAPFPWQCLHRLFEATAARNPDAIAVDAHGGAKGKQLSYAALNERADRLAAYLRGQGVGPEVLVGLCLPRTPNLIVATLAVFKAGGAYLPLDPIYPAERLTYMLRDAGVRLVLTGRGIPLPSTSDVRRIDWDEAHHGGQNGRPPGFLTRPENIAYLLYTSGSTGRPKGIVLPHRGPAALISWAQTRFSRAHLERVLAATSVCFDLSVFEIFAPLCAGTTTVLVENLLCLAHPDAPPGITLVNAVPSSVTELVRMDRFPTGVKLLNLAGERIPEDLLEILAARYPGMDVWNLYGPTEDSTYATEAQLLPDHRPRVIIGTSIANKNGLILDSFLEPVPNLVVGELFLGGIGLARGYHRNATLTAQRFLPNPYSGKPGDRLYATGDLGRRLGDRGYELLGRCDHQLKIRGFRIEPGEIEVVLCRHPMIVKAAVLPWFRQGTHTRLAAYVVAGPGKGLNTHELLSFLHKKLPSFMIPSTFEFLDTLPLTLNGKLDRSRLPEPKHASSPEISSPPNTDRERAIAAVWSEILGVAAVHRHDNFFALGGDSILSLQLIARARHKGLHLTPSQVFQHQDVAGQAAVATTSPALAGEQGLVCGEHPLTPIQTWFFANKPDEAHHFNQSRLLVLPKLTDALSIARAIALIWDHHDVLRSRFFDHEDRGWIQQTTKRVCPQLRVIDLSGLGKKVQAPTLRTCCAAFQAGLNLSEGPLVRTVHFTLGAGGPDKLLMAAHHLVADGVSWRILIEDLHHCLCQAFRGLTMSLSPKTTSYKTWATHLARRTPSLITTAEKAYWKSVIHGPKALLPRDFPADPEANTQASAAQLTLRLAPAETERLLRGMHTAYRTRHEEVLVCALVRTLVPLLGAGVYLYLEGHGREPIFPDVDLSRTVGWFTSLYPVFLEGGDLPPGPCLLLVKERMRRVPTKGIGYGLLRFGERTLEKHAEPEIVFNYLGQLSRRSVPLATEPCGPERSGKAKRVFLLEINAFIRDEQLHIRWAYSRNHHRTQTVTHLARRFLDELTGLIHHCGQPGVGRLSPADFPGFACPQEELDRLAAEIGREGIEDIYPLSPMQEGMLFHTLAAPGSGAYVEQFTTTLVGPLRIDALLETWRLLLAAHPALRTCFRWRHLRQPLQIALTGDQPTWTLIDLSGQGSRLQRRLLADFLAGDRRRGFAIEGRTPMRFALFYLEKDRYQLIWSYHHALLDGWSLASIRTQMTRVLAALQHGAAPKLERSFGFGDFIRWTKGQDMTRAETFWRENLKGFTNPTRLLTPAVSEMETQAGHHVHKIRLNQEDSGALRKMARLHHLTPASLLQGAWALLLGAYSGQNDVVFGVTVSGRQADLPGVTSMIGMLINSLPARVRLPHAAHLVPWLRELGSTQIESERFAYTPLVSLKKWSGLDSGSPLFESLFVHENYPAISSSGGHRVPLRTENSRLHESGAYPISILSRFKTCLSLSLNYDPRRFEAAVARGVLVHYTNLLAHMVADPWQRLSDCSPVSSRERNRLLKLLNQTEIESRTEPFLGDWLHKHARVRPDRIALEDGEGSVSYAELERGSNAVAATLQTLGVGPEVLVGVLLPPSPELFVIILGLFKLGGIYFPLDPASPRERLRLILEETEVSFLITDSIEANPSVKALFISRRRLASAAREDRNSPTKTNRYDENLAYAICTSGSTGKPKGVAITHAGLRNLALAQARIFEPPPDSRILQFTSPGFDASIWELCMSLRAGAALCLAPPLALMPGPMLAACLRERAITHITLPASCLAVLDSQSFPALCCLITAGDTCSPDLAQRWSARYRLFNAYGPTETTVCATVAELHDERVSIGRPIGNKRVYVVNRRLQPVPTAVVGELCIGGTGQARGYLGRPERTAERFVPDPFSGAAGARIYRTGDLVHYNYGRDPADLSFLGRVDHQVKIRGFRIELGEIETHLSAHPRIRRAVVVVRDDPERGRQLAAFFVPRERRSARAALRIELRRYLESCLPHYMVPALFVSLTTMPRMTSGKIDRAILLDLAVPKRGSRTPKSQTEHRIAEVWRAVLGLDEVGVHDNFFEMGGDSLLLAATRDRLESVLGISLSIADLFKSATIRGLATSLEQNKTKHLVAGRERARLRQTLRKRLPVRRGVKQTVKR